MPGALTLSYAIGLLYQQGIFDHILALTAINNLSFKSPVMVGDEIEAEATVSSKRETQKPGMGVVSFAMSCRNKTRNTTCLQCEMTFIIMRQKS